MAPSRRKSKSLSNGRPKAIQSTSKPSSRNSRKLINDFHSISKALARAQKAGDDNSMQDLQAQLDARGGLQQYQEASKAGQSARRGGDSSRVLMEWIGPYIIVQQSEVKGASDHKLRLLEVGALASDNACARSGIFDVTRIDLNSQHSKILKQDFMERPLPQNDTELFDCISLSLVVNYCPDATGRGEMLKRVVKFLQRPIVSAIDKGRGVVDHTNHVPPSLFLVLPAPCVTNSRYLDEARLAAIMTSLGFMQAFRKMSAKLVYYLWVLQRERSRDTAFPKNELNPGSGRNNFAIIVQ